MLKILLGVEKRTKRGERSDYALDEFGSEIGRTAHSWASRRADAYVSAASGSLVAEGLCLANSIRSPIRRVYSSLMTNSSERPVGREGELSGRLNAGAGAALRARRCGVPTSGGGEATPSRLGWLWWIIAAPYGRTVKAVCS
jgi:hypothetical protein